MYVCMPNNLYMCACVLHVRVFVYWHLSLTFLSCSLRGCIACFVIFICLCRNTDIIAVYTSRCRVHPSFTHTHNTHINIHMLLHVFECVVSQQNIARNGTEWHGIREFHGSVPFRAIPCLIFFYFFDFFIKMGSPMNFKGTYRSKKCIRVLTALYGWH